MSATPSFPILIRGVLRLIGLRAGIAAGVASSDCRLKCQRNGGRHKASARDTVQQDGMA